MGNGEREWRKERAGEDSPLLLTTISARIRETGGGRQRKAELFFCARRRAERSPEEGWGEIFDLGEWDWEKPGEGLCWIGRERLPEGSPLEGLAERLKARLLSRGVALGKRLPREPAEPVLAGPMLLDKRAQVAGVASGSKVWRLSYSMRF